MGNLLTHINGQSRDAADLKYKRIYGLKEFHYSSLSPSLYSFYISLSSLFKEIFSPWQSKKAPAASGHKLQERKPLALLGFHKVIPDTEIKA